MTDDEKNLYGWNMRIIQLEEDVWRLEKRLKKIKIIRDGIKFIVEQTL